MPLSTTAMEIRFPSKYTIGQVTLHGKQYFSVYIQIYSNILQLRKRLYVSTFTNKMALTWYIYKA